VNEAESKKKVYLAAVSPAMEDYGYIVPMSTARQIREERT
jgi:hypothetical protein